MDRCSIADDDIMEVKKRGNADVSIFCGHFMRQHFVCFATFGRSTCI